jgi:hypothetical protein
MNRDAVDLVAEVSIQVTNEGFEICHSWSFTFVRTSAIRMPPGAASH